MTSATWTNANPGGCVVGGFHAVCRCDIDELAAAMDRRRGLTYQTALDLSTGAYVRADTIPMLRQHLLDLLAPPTGTFAGSPPSPISMEWLWPLSDSRQNRVIVSGRSAPEADEVALLAELNGTQQWTDEPLAASSDAVRATHLNELRQAMEWLTRGRWRLPLYLPSGLFSVLPDTPWGGGVANNGTDELRNIGFGILCSSQTPAMGLTNVTIRPESTLTLTADADCILDIYHCLRPLDFTLNPPTWNEYDPIGHRAWSQPGGAGPGDASFIAQLALQAQQSGELTGSALASALQAMVDGAEQNLLIHRADINDQTIVLDGALEIIFDVNLPPN